MNLFVDDIRKCPEGWTLARTVKDAVRILDTQNVEIVSLDHDIVFQENEKFTGFVHPETFETVARFIRRLPAEERPKTVYVHTANPYGAKVLMTLLSEHVNVIRDSKFASEWLDKEAINENE